MRVVKALIRNVLHRRGLEIINTRRHYDSDGLFTIHSDHFRNDPVFQSAYRRGVEANNGLDPHLEWRLHVALWAAASAVAIPGDFVECGVNTGFMSSAIMHALNWNEQTKRFCLFDTYAGPVLSQFSREEIERGRDKVAKEGIASGAYETNLARVHANFAEWPNAIVVPGVVPDKPAGHAPIDNRTANSFARACDRASRRFARFAHAASNTSPTTAISTTSGLPNELRIGLNP